MGYICSVCNGLTTLHAACSNCNHPLDDYGRIDDLWGAYSPYQELEDLKMTNGFEDSRKHQCVHIATCPICGKVHYISIDEQQEM